MFYKAVAFTRVSPFQPFFCSRKLAKVVQDMIKFDALAPDRGSAQKMLLE